jgi:phosphatidylinositol alpha-1,6-mannosyltransferase
MPRVLLGAGSIDPGNGGICRVARLMAKVLAEERDAGRLDVTAEVYEDKTPTGQFGFPVRTANRSKAGFLLNVHRSAFSCSHAIYDSDGMARARPHIPLLRRPWLAWMHGIEVWENTLSRRPGVLKSAHVLVSNSEYTKQRANRAWGNFERARVCWLATEHDDPPTARSPADGPPRVLIVGRIDDLRYKGHDELISIWPRVCGAVPGAELLIVGRGNGSRRIAELAARSPAAACIKCVGFISEQEMEPVWAGSSVFAMPSRGEGFGLVYVEAMRQGLPVIASTEDAAQEINQHGGTGYNVPLSTLGDLENALIHLLRNRDEAARLGANAREHWRRHFRYSCFRQRWRPLLHDLLSQCPG